MPHAHPSYRALSPSSQTDLQVITHFILSFPSLLSLAPHQLTSIESSILSHSGPICTSLLTFLSTHVDQTKQATADLPTLSTRKRLRHLRALVDNAASSKPVRAAFGKHLEGYVRMVGKVSDSAGVWYYWMRGVYALSSRIIADHVVIHDPLTHADMLEQRDGKGDRYAANWIRARLHTARKKAQVVVEEWEREEKERVEREERERERREREQERREKEQERRERDCMLNIVVGKRKTRLVSYQEESDNSLDSLDSHDSQGDVEEEIIDGGDGDYSDSDSEEDDDEEEEQQTVQHTVMPGRVRVTGISDRDVRAARRFKLKLDHVDSFKAKRGRRRASLRAREAIKSYS